jgi:hypothetical protein
MYYIILYYNDESRQPDRVELAAGNTAPAHVLVEKVRAPVPVACGPFSVGDGVLCISWYFARIRPFNRVIRVIKVNRVMKSSESFSASDGSGVRLRTPLFSPQWSVCQWWSVTITIMPPSHPSHPSHRVGHCESVCDGSGARFELRGDTDNLNAIAYIISLHSGVWGLPTVEAVCVRASEPLSESSDLFRHVCARRLHRDCLRAYSDTFCLLLACALHFPFSDDSSYPSESSEPSSRAL